MIAYVHEDDGDVGEKGGGARCTFIAGTICGNGSANILVNRHELYMLIRDEFAINLRLIVTRRSNVIAIKSRLPSFVEFCNFDIDFFAIALDV